MTLYHPRPERWPQFTLKGLLIGVTLAALLFIVTGSAIGAGPEKSPEKQVTADQKTESALVASFQVPVPVLALAVSPDGKHIVTSGRSGISLWDATNGRLAATNTTASAGNTPLAFSPGRPLLAVVGHAKRVGGIAGRREVILLDATTLVMQSKIETGIHSVVALAFSPDGKKLVGSASTATIVWAMGGQAAEQVLPDSRSDGALAFSPLGKFFATGSPARSIQIWDAISLRPTAELKTSATKRARIQSLAFSPDDKLLAVGWEAVGEKNASQRMITAIGFQVWNVQTRSIVFESSQPGHRSYVTFSPRENILATYSGAMCLWNLDRILPERSRFVGPVLTAVNVAQFPPDGKTLATASETTVKLWNVEKLLAIQDP